MRSIAVCARAWFRALTSMVVAAAAWAFALSAPCRADIVDYGLGPGIVPAQMGTPPTPSVPPPGTRASASIGMFGAPVQWPIIPLHVVLTPDGRVLNYGSTDVPQQGGNLVYDVWNPSLGVGTNAHLVLPNITGTDIFCAGQLVLPNNGEVLIVGGDLTVKGKRNYSQSMVELFNPAANTLSPLDKMVYPRWYPSAVALPDGDVVVIGGRLTPTKPAIVPEIFDSLTGWRALFGASSQDAFGNSAEFDENNETALNQGWYYPRAFYTASGNILIVGYGGQFFLLNPTGNGSISQLATTTSTSSNRLPITMYAPGQLFLIRYGGVTETIDITGAEPVITAGPSVFFDRNWASTTVMADGRVFFNGGDITNGKYRAQRYQTYIWDPASNTMQTGPVATKPRMYHSSALLLPDGSVFTGGGGVPGPIQEMNAEIYYPAYLYRQDGSGLAATRPVVSLDQASVATQDSITGTIGQGATISRVNMIRTGAATHGANLDQRLVSLPFTQTGTTFSATLPDTSALTPGYYMVFVFDAFGVPAVASIVHVTWPVAAPR